ncbi:MAG: hypothetical protein ACFFD2_18895, partial [Promethearchaeota archaeon]
MNEFQQRLKYLNAMEKRVRRLLLKGENKKAIKLLEDVIEDYKKIGVNQKAEILEINLKEMLKESDIKVKNIAQLTTEKDNPAQLSFYIEALEKKVKRRFLQGKTMEAIADLKFIITELRKIEQFEKADLLETTLNEFISELSATSSQYKIQKSKELPSKASVPKIIVSNKDKLPIQTFPVAPQSDNPSSDEPHPIFQFFAPKSEESEEPTETPSQSSNEPHPIFQIFAPKSEEPETPPQFFSQFSNMSTPIIEIVTSESEESETPPQILSRSSNEPTPIIENVTSK